MQRHFLVTVTLVMFPWGHAHAQFARQPANDAGGELVTRVYRVTDLVLETRNYSFSGIDLPELTNGSVGSSGFMGGAGGGGGGGFGGGTSSGGVFAVNDDFRLAQFQSPGTGAAMFGGTPSRRAGLRLTSDDLIHVLTSSVQPESWNDVGGAGRITTVAGMLVVLQTPRVHQQISALLNELRKEGVAVNSLTVRAYWLPSNKISGLLIDHRQVNRTELAKQIEAQGAVGQISCFDSQTVHLVTGNVRSILTSVIPVVGQVEKISPSQYAGMVPAPVPGGAAPQPPKSVLAQITGGGGGVGVSSGTDGGDGFSLGAGRVGYSPVTKTNVFGGLLQLTASLDPSRRTAVLDVHSIVIRPRQDQAKPVEFNRIAKLENLNVVVQQFKTTLRLPINQPVLVGGSTLEPLQDTETRQQLYLIMEVLIDE